MSDFDCDNGGSVSGWLMLHIAGVVTYRARTTISRLAIKVPVQQQEAHHSALWVVRPVLGQERDKAKSAE